MWLCVLFVHNGPWQGGVFRFVLKFPDSFPDASSQNNLPVRNLWTLFSGSFNILLVHWVTPNLHLCLQVVQFTGSYPKCHPLINPSRGTFDIKRYYKTYNRSSHHIWQLLKCTRKIFYKLEIIDKILYPNKTAAELYLQSEEQFLRKCDQDVQNSKSKVYDEDMYSKDPNYIRFSRDYARIDNVNGSSEDNTLSSGIGLSFMSTHSSLFDLWTHLLTCPTLYL